MCNRNFLTLVFSFVIFIFLPVSGMVWAEKTDTMTLLPEGLVISDKFQPGLGASVGKVINVVGKVVIYHKNKLIAYEAKSQLPMFKGDTLVSLGDGSIQIKFKDSSRMRLGNQTKIVINESRFSPKAKDRSIFLNLIEGKARFLIKKILGFRRSEFRVKTHDSIAGVRGSDFVIIAASDYTEIFAFENTRIELIELTIPNAEPVILNSFEKIMHKKGELMTKPEKIDPAIVKQLQKELPFQEESSEGESGNLTLYNEERPVDEYIIFDEDDLIPPESIAEINSEKFDRALEDDTLETIMNQQNNIFQIKHEDYMKNRVLENP